MAKFRELTYRFEFLDPRIVRDMATRLIGQRVVIRMPDSDIWKRAWLISVSKSGDRFRVRWTRNHSRYTTLVGIWRVHNPILFSQKGLLPVPVEPAKVRSNHKPIPGGKMATRSRSTSSKKSSSTKSSGSKKATGGNNGGGRRDKLGHMTEAQRKKAAATIYKMRGQGKSWGEIMEVVDIPGSMTGRRLLRDYGPDDAESVIRERKVGNNSKKSDTAKAKSKRRAAEPDDDEDDDEDEAPKRRTRRVKAKRGRGSKSNPSS